MWIKSNAKIAHSDIGCEEKELLDRCMEGLGIFMIWSGRPKMMNYDWILFDSK